VSTGDANCALGAPPFETKITAANALVAKLKAVSRPLVFTNGVFDVLHRGHATYLAQARLLGACLVVAINTDASARRLNKGPERPLNSAEDRAALLAALASVDFVTFFDEDTPLELIAKLHPDILVKGGDYDMDRLAEARLVRSWGGEALAIPFLHDRSTSALVRRIREAGI
jgi:D-glycero-beta-D-manno-heptose 1-phosphate adenylyltransferase